MKNFLENLRHLWWAVADVIETVIIIAVVIGLFLGGLAGACIGITIWANNKTAEEFHALTGMPTKSSLYLGAIVQLKDGRWVDIEAYKRNNLVVESK